jgi:hypothetical protein
VVVSGLPNVTPDLLAELVDEVEGRADTVRDARELADGLAHQPRLESPMGIAHVTFELGARRERRYRVDHDEVDRAGSHQLDPPEDVRPPTGIVVVTSRAFSA